jgi:hypothetical protein
MFSGLFCARHEILLFSKGIRKGPRKVTLPKQGNSRNYKGINLFCLEGQNLLLTALRGKYIISGFRNKDKDAKMKLPAFSTGKVSRLIKRLKAFGLIKRVEST